MVRALLPCAMGAKSLLATTARPLYVHEEKRRCTCLHTPRSTPIESATSFLLDEIGLSPQDDRPIYVVEAAAFWAAYRHGLETFSAARVFKVDLALYIS